MTMPHLMNCPHSTEFHCLKCVKEEWERTDSIISNQAEAISVLRETIAAYVPNEIIAFWREVASGDCPVYDDIREEVKRRLAAFEGRAK